MTLDRKVWRGKADWTGAATEGEDHEQYNRKPLFRYKLVLRHPHRALHGPGRCATAGRPVGARIAAGSLIAAARAPSRPSGRQGRKR